jgi:hypothetical protein
MLTALAVPTQSSRSRTASKWRTGAHHQLCVGAGVGLARQSSDLQLALKVCVQTYVLQPTFLGTDALEEAPARFAGQMLAEQLRRGRQSGGAKRSEGLGRQTAGREVGDRDPFRPDGPARTTAEPQGIAVALQWRAWDENESGPPREPTRTS